MCLSWCPAGKAEKEQTVNFSNRPIAWPDNGQLVGLRERKGLAFPALITGRIEAGPAAAGSTGRD